MPYNTEYFVWGVNVNNILLITDVARLRNIFGHLKDENAVRLRIANNLEKGGDEIASDKPDVVFVQTHLSGLSAEILITHLKKQLGGASSHFVLLAAPHQVSEEVLAHFQGWLNTSSEDEQLLCDLRVILSSLSSTGGMNDKTDSGQPATEAATTLLPPANDAQPPEQFPAKIESTPEVAIAPLCNNALDRYLLATLPPVGILRIQ